VDSLKHCQIGPATPLESRSAIGIRDLLLVSWIQLSRHYSACVAYVTIIAPLLNQNAAVSDYDWLYTMRRM